MSLIEILQNDGNIHVDDNHEVDNDKGDEVDDGNKREAAVSVWKILVVRVTVWRLGHERVQDVIPACRGHQSRTNKQTSAVRRGRMSAPIIEPNQKQRGRNSTWLPTTV